MTSIAHATEEITKAWDGANLVADPLRGVLAAETPVESLLLLSLITRAHELLQDVHELRSARASDSS